RTPSLDDPPARRRDEDPPRVTADAHPGCLVDGAEPRQPALPRPADARRRAGDARPRDPLPAGPAQARLEVIFGRAAVLFVTAGLAGSAGTPGVTPTSILLGGTVPLSGPASAFGVIGPSAAAYF